MEQSANSAAVAVGQWVRPYTRTGGRTTPSRELSVEALVIARIGAASSVRSIDEQAIYGMCLQPKSVAEVAALSHLPICAARVLIATLADNGVVDIAPQAVDSQDRPTMDMLQRVLLGLRRL